VHRAEVDPDDRVERDGVWVTGILQTLLDLCRSRPIAEAVVAVDSALRQGRVSVEELTGALRDLPAGRGRDRVARALLLIDPQSGSVLETLCRVLLHQAGLAPDETQLVVRDAQGRWIGRVDFAWPTARLIVEADGFAFHTDRKSLRADRRRGNALVLEGWRCCTSAGRTSSITRTRWSPRGERRWACPEPPSYGFSTGPGGVARRIARER